MMKNTLYGQLLRSLYVLDGIDGEFLGALAEPLSLDRENVRHRLGFPVTLTPIPSKTVARLRREASAAKGRLARHQAHFAHLVREDKVRDCGEPWEPGTTSSAAAFAQAEELRAELAEAKEALAEVLA